jgi:hypothetical protein
MVIELAQLKIQPGREAAFKQAYASVEHLLTTTMGHALSVDGGHAMPG